MKKQKWIRKGMAFVLSLAMVAGLVPAMSGGANTVQAATGSGTEPSVTAYATKDQLMTAFNPDANGTATTTGKLVFGKNENRTSQQWYILGKDNGVSGDNTIIFASSPIATGQVFNSDTSDKTYDSTTVNANHYGASDLRVALQNMATNTSYFTTAEQGLMNPTTVTTNNTKNSINYTTTDKLYALAADGYGSTTIKAGTNNQTVLAMSKYWSRGTWFWLRSPYGPYDNYALPAIPGFYVYRNDVGSDFAVQPASNLNLSSVLFASAAQAASSDTVESDTIAPEAAMTLRLNGTGKNIGTVTYNTTTGDIKVVRGDTSQTVALVVQGNDGTNDWYYSKKIDAAETVNASAINSALSLSSDIDLSGCKIWLEITDTDGMIYAVGATEVLSITSVEITGIDTPVSNNALDTEASCATTGVSSTTPSVKWTPNDSTAGYNTSYTASITLTADTGYEFTDSTTATVNTYTATGVTKNDDGTLTVTYAFPATAKRVIGSITAPEVPTNNIFTTYYGYEGYDISPVSESNSELGTQATVTFTDSVNPNTEAMDVAWSIANADDAPYDKTPGAENIFRWTIPASALTNYDDSVCQGYDTATGTITGTVTITNKAAIPVTITGTDSGVAYTGATIDVSQYFTIDSHAGTATYSLVVGENGGTGMGTLSGTTLTVTKTGTFKIKVETLANGIYGAGEKTITLTVSNGTILYTATDYSGTYDGLPHSISVNVTNPVGTIISYSTDGENYGSDNPSFTNAGNYTVYYRITKDNYNTISESRTVNVAKAASAPNKPDSTMDVDYGKEKVSDITTLPEGWAWQDEDQDKALTVGTAVKATAVYTGADKGNYQTESVEISITRLECTHATTEVKNEKDATCTKKGYTGDTYCKDCGAKLASGKEIEMTAHKWDAGKVTKEPTLSAEGVKTYTCSVCGKTKTEAISKKTATTRGRWPARRRA